MSCQGQTLLGNRCRKRAKYDNKFCHNHYQEECCICLENVTPRISPKLDCGHWFHQKCLSGWMVNDNFTCPLCRKELNRNIITLFNAYRDDEPWYEEDYEEEDYEEEDYEESFDLNGQISQQALPDHHVEDDLDEYLGSATCLFLLVTAIIPILFFNLA